MKMLFLIFTALLMVLILGEASAEVVIVKPMPQTCTQNCSTGVAGTFCTTTCY